VRQSQLRVARFDALEEQYIDIERARPKSEAPPAVTRLLDRLAGAQQLARRKARLETQDLVEEGRLVDDVLRRGLVDTRRSEQRRAGQPRKSDAGRGQIGGAVSKVRAEGHEGATPLRRTRLSVALIGLHTGPFVHQRA